jgi:diadenosine tetraphosphate (Ap4A) HIT family hydrolase
LIEKIIKETIKPDKINIASLGNYVPHLHIHIIPRYKDDSWYPDSIWSNKHREYKYKTTKEDINNLVERIRQLDI